MDYEAIIDVLVSGGYIVEADRERAALRLSARFPEHRAEASGELKPCPFCGGQARRIDIPAIDGEPNAGGSAIECTACRASSVIAFGEKIGLEESWNRRARPAPTDEMALRGLINEMLSNLDMGRPCICGDEPTRSVLVYQHHLDDWHTRYTLLAREAPADKKAIRSEWLDAKINPPKNALRCVCLSRSGRLFFARHAGGDWLDDDALRRDPILYIAPPILDHEAPKEGA